MDKRQVQCTITFHTGVFFFWGLLLLNLPFPCPFGDRERRGLATNLILPSRDCDCGSAAGAGEGDSGCCSSAPGRPESSAESRGERTTGVLELAPLLVPLADCVLRALAALPRAPLGVLKVTRGVVLPLGEVTPLWSGEGRGEAVAHLPSPAASLALSEDFAAASEPAAPRLVLSSATKQIKP